MLDEERADGSSITISGLVTSVQRKVTKKGDTWVLTQLEDLAGSIEVMIFPSTYQLCSTVVAEDAIVFVKGRIDKREDVAKIIAMEVTVPDLTQEAGGPVKVNLPLARCTPPVVGRLKEILTTHPGTSEVHLQVRNGPRTTVLRVDDRLRVDGSDWLYAIGDVNGRALLTHMGKYQGRVCADVILGRDATATAERLGSPRVVFAEPQLGAVGLTLDGVNQFVKHGDRQRSAVLTRGQNLTFRTLIKDSLKPIKSFRIDGRIAQEKLLSPCQGQSLR